MWSIYSLPFTEGFIFTLEYKQLKIGLVGGTVNPSNVIVKNIINLNKVLHLKYVCVTSLVVYWSGSMTTNHEVPVSIPGSNIGIFPCRERFLW